MRKSGDRLRITAQLVETETGFHLWSDSYDREMQDIFVIQTEIAGSIAQALKMSLVGPDQAVPVAQTAQSLPADDLFLQARRLIQGRTRTGLEAARKLLDEALILDPDYAPALAAAAESMLLLSDRVAGCGDIPPDRAVAIAQPLLDRALAMAPEGALGPTLNAFLSYALGDFERVLSLSALRMQGQALVALGRTDESVARARERLAIVPQDDVAATDLLFTLSAAGLHDDPAFQTQLGRMIELINSERAKLGMGPLP